MLGGAMFQYTLRGDRNEQKQGLQPVAGDLQRKALDQVCVKEEEMRMEGGDKIEKLTQRIGRLYYFFFALSVGLSVGLSTCLSVYLSLYLPLSLSVCLPLCLPAYLSMSFSLYLYLPSSLALGT